MRPKHKGLEKVDAFLVPKKDAGEYKRRRRIARNAAKRALRKVFPYVISDWEGSEDGEGVLALDGHGQLMACVHLDPEGVDLILKGMEDRNLLEILLEINGTEDGEDRSSKLNVAVNRI